MKRLFLLLILCTTLAHAERWVEVGPLVYVNIDYTVDTQNSNIRIYVAKNLDYHTISIIAIDCKLNLFSIYESYYMSNNKWNRVPQSTPVTWHQGTKDQVYSLICR